MNLETKITIYKFTPQVFTLTLKDQRNNLRDFMTQFENLGELKLPKSFH